MLHLASHFDLDGHHVMMVCTLIAGVYKRHSQCERQGGSCHDTPLLPPTIGMLLVSTSMILLLGNIHCPDVKLKVGLNIGLDCAMTSPSYPQQSVCFLSPLA